MRGGDVVKIAIRNFLRDLTHAAIFAAVIGAPFAIYFWNMKP